MKANLFIVLLCLVGGLLLVSCSSGGDDDDDDGVDDDDVADDDLLDDDASDDDIGDDDTGDDDDDDTGDDDTGTDDDDTDTSPALSFNGLDQSGQIAYDPLFDLQTLTVECWFYLDLLPPDNTNFYPLVAKETYHTKATNGYGWRLSVINYDGSSTVGFVIYDAVTYKVALGSTVLVTDTWYHVAAMYDGSNLRIYLDGELDGLQNFSGTISYDDRPIDIGACPSPSNCMNHNGRIDEIRISDSARYSDDFSTEFEFGSVDANTVALWHLNEGSGDVFWDSGINGLHGTLNSDDMWAMRP